MSWEDTNLASLMEKDKSQVKFATYQWKMINYFNTKVKKMSFLIKDLVLRSVFPSSK